MAGAAALVSLPQDANPWLARAQAFEVEGRVDHAAVALARALVDDDRETARRELARLTEGTGDLLWTRRLGPTAAPEGPPLCAAAGKVVCAGPDFHVFDEGTGALLAEPIPVQAVRVALDPTGRRVAVLEASGCQSVWDFAAGTRAFDLGDVSGWGGVAWSADGAYVAAIERGSTEAHAGVWNAATGRARYRSPALAVGTYYELALSAEGRFLALAGDTVELYDVHAQRLVAGALGGGECRIAFDPQRPRLMVHGAGGPCLRAYDLTAERWVGPPLGGLSSLGPSGAIGCDAAGTRWVVATDLEVTATDSVTGAPAGAPLEGDELDDPGRSHAGLRAAALAADGGRWARAGIDDTVRVWDTTTGRRFAPVLRHGARVAAVTFTAAGRLVTASNDGLVRVWALDGLAPADTASDSDAYAVHLVPELMPVRRIGAEGASSLLSPDGTLGFAQRRDGTGSWFDLTTGAELFTATRMRELEFAPDGGLLVERSRLGRLAAGGFVVGATRRCERSSWESWLFDDRPSVNHAGGDRWVVGATPTPDGVRFFVSDFGPATCAPLQGAPETLLATWSARLGLAARPDGEVAPIGH